MQKNNLTNAMSVDVEDYFQVSAFEKVISRDSWDNLNHRVEQNTDRILQIFSNCNIHATFFMLGWVAEHYPNLVRRIVESGHELASHGYNHIRVTTQNPKSFKEDVSRTKKLLEDLSGISVVGYRAASYSIGRNNLWAHEILADTGYRYSSSIYPVRHDLYGMPEAPRFAFQTPKALLLEIPISTVRLFKQNFPCGGGGYFRLFPYRLSRWALRRVNQKDNQPCVFYFHPWEIDPEQPQQKNLKLKTRIRHYLNLKRMEKRLIRLISEFHWDRIDKVFPSKI
ncbi:XrtA system polysaccharide deacetylase [Candidatus Nitrosacidococcus tergens]|uniref:Polysaccharide deactylase family protein, PEP-CTERM locus subfamily n=1 Tax=Candidatus Nitrosacidococcus tergens TaxID=553981 RepID=A0A7G1QAT6_9GAMM|nr:XrtA system polysaccharide deacetylase [Candidatus Nitrosacidococcus tergens]CAB1276781.1 Polysaccharide deactylase family protein, PEP-CTERM locus subfamily [Candidatus Nitrosacidococcus tergens]